MTEFNADYVYDILISGSGYERLFSKIRKLIEKAAEKGKFEVRYSLPEVYGAEADTDSMKLLSMIGEELVAINFKAWTAEDVVGKDGKKHFTLFVSW